MGCFRLIICNFLLKSCCFHIIRLNEVQELKIIDIKNLIQYGNVKINISKTSSERKLYLTNTFQKELVKIFDLKNENDDNRIITKGANKNKKTSINNINARATPIK